MFRGGVVVPLRVQPDGDATWSANDWARAATLEARWFSSGVSEEERRMLLPCAVLRAKFPGIAFHPFVETRLRELACAI